MKKILIIITIIFIHLSSYGQTDSDSSVHSFYKAYAALQNMLDGKDSLNYEKAVFITENAYHDNYFNYEDFKNLIDFHAGIINAYAENVRLHYKEKYKTLKPWEQTYFISNTDNWAIFKYITDTAFVIINKDKYIKTPYNYTAYDPYGSDNWENTQVLSLLLSNEKQGNCYSLAVLFKLFSNRFKSDARLTITPHHIYIQNRNQRGGFYNVELASKTFPGDGTIQTLTYTTNTSIINGMAQRMLSDKEAVALNLIYLAKGYQHKYKDNTNNFLLQCAELAIKHDSLSMNALLLKAEVTENRLLAAIKANKITTLSKARANPQTQKLINSYEDQLSNLYALGYREIPKEIEKNILAHIQHRNEGYILKDQTPNPFASIKAKQRYATLSNGLFEEMHEAVDTIQYYQALLNTKTKKIIKLLPIEASDEYKVDPVVFALSVDPLSDKYPNISPYAYCAWNPVMLVDPDGNKPVFYKVLELRGQAKAGVSRAGSSWNYGSYTISPIYDANNKNLIGFNAGRAGADGNFRTEYQMDAGDIGEFTKNIGSYTAAANLAYTNGEPNMDYMMLGQNIAEGNASGSLGNLADAWVSAVKDPEFWAKMIFSLGVSAVNISTNNINSIVSNASKGTGNFGVGTASVSEANTAGAKWVGEGSRVSSNGKTWISADGTRQYRPPTIKSRSGRYQANFQSRNGTSGEWTNNGHLDIK
jgi:hypothetical protein